MKRGRIFTFYSYKGGTGRTMALANAGVLLARRGSPVLLVDWDLEAPGLHRYFPAPDGEPPAGGVLGLFEAVRDVLASDPSIRRESDGAARVWSSVPLDRYLRWWTEAGSDTRVAILPAGDLAKGYGSRVNKFDWEALFDRAPWLFRSFAELLASRFEYVLVDSRTGVTDTSGICTAVLPETLVAVFTPNKQSLLGAVDVARSAVEYRKDSDDLRPLIVFPLASRIELAEPRLRETWRKGEDGYQPLFERLVAEQYSLDRPSLEEHFNETQIQHMPRYAYGEEIAVIAETAPDRLSLSRSYATLVDRLLAGHPPWKSALVEHPFMTLEEPVRGLRGRAN